MTGTSKYWVDPENLRGVPKFLVKYRHLVWASVKYAYVDYDSGLPFKDLQAAMDHASWLDKQYTNSGRKLWEVEGVYQLGFSSPDELWAVIVRDPSLGSNLGWACLEGEYDGKLEYEWKENPTFIVGHILAVQLGTQVAEEYREAEDNSTSPELFKGVKMAIANWGLVPNSSSTPRPIHPLAAEALDASKEAV